MAGPTPAVSLRNTPSDFNLSFGKNIFTLQDTAGATDQVKFGLNILSGSTGGTQVATLRQFENPSGTAHFDLQNILKNYTTPNPELQSITGITNGRYETFRFVGEVGYEIGGTFTISEYATGSTGSYCVIGGRKQFNDLAWGAGFVNHIPIITEILGCPASVAPKYALTDWSQEYTTDYNSETPSWAQGKRIYTQKISTDSNAKRTLSYLNRITNPIFGTISDKRRTIKGFRITIMSGTSQLDDFYIENIISNGGGPNTDISGTTYDTYPYDVISVQCGHDMYTADTSNATHWFVGTFTLNDSGCLDVSLPYWSQPLHHVYRFDVNEGECNDFDIVEFSWLNSFGVRDYFDFRKRKDYNISIERNTYEQLEGTWSAADYSVNSYDRGEKTFSQSIQERYTCNTGYLSDNEAEFLKNLYLSADVKVRFEGDSDYYSVTLEDSQWTERTFRKDKLFQNTVTFRMANKINSQRG
jgi:hypothetical protein